MSAIEEDLGGEIIEREFADFTVRFENCGIGQWLTAKGEPAKKPRRRYLIDGVEVCSPSQLAGCLDKPALTRWIERESVIGAVYAERAGELYGVPEQDWPWRVQSIRLGASAKRDQGAERGTVVHEALHTLAVKGRVPDPMMVADYARPWLQAAVLAWQALDVRKVIEAETIVGHPELGFAGRFDLFAMCGPDNTLTLIDWKTSPKGEVYPESHWQARAYAVAIERSLQTSVEAVKLIGVGPEGGFELIDCEITRQDLESLIAVHYARKRVEASQRAQRRVPKAAA
jgi:hypothetical protein